jgi:hypothetical protein
MDFGGTGALCGWRSFETVSAPRPLRASESERVSAGEQATIMVTAAMKLTKVGLRMRSDDID